MTSLVIFKNYIKFARSFTSKSIILLNRNMQRVIKNRVQGYYYCITLALWSTAYAFLFIIPNNTLCLI